PVPFSTYELPFHAIDYCLAEAGIQLTDVDHVAYSYDPWLLVKQARSESVALPLEPDSQGAPAGLESPWDPLFLTSMINAPRHLAHSAPHHLEHRLRGIDPANSPYRWHFVVHHLAHAASAFLPSPFARAAVMTLDGRGERATATYAIGEGTQLSALGQVQMPHSLGLLYEEVTRYLGFLHSSDEYKVMALASYGNPLYASQFRDAIRLDERGQFTIERLNFEDIFGPRRERGGSFDQRHFDIAHSLQVVLEETVLEIAEWLFRETAADDLCLAGGVALNCVLNARLRDRGPFKRIWVQPAAGDAGTALGAALWIDAAERGAAERPYRMDHAFLGPQYGEAQIQEFLDWSKLPYRRMNDIAEETAALLADDKIIGWHQGRMEFGPRALGARSILASPLNASMQSRLNDLKDREDFRPVAPVVLEEHAGRWFKEAGPSPFMLFVFETNPDKVAQIPAVTHVDGTARIQTINRLQHPLYYDLLQAFYRRTGVPVLVNTSFNTRGEPIVCSPRDAVESFWTSPLDALVIGPFLLQKPERIP
ncbi:MAG TPA: carbamoyltransferase C-terminal domain-containing protein, partial [Planctomycetaceae bacterium]|nr:carbamoyltransferase C-terminal domain-containing protein [Planctomycetaceae bacterium]